MSTLIDIADFNYLLIKSQELLSEVRNYPLDDSIDKLQYVIHLCLLAIIEKEDGQVQSKKKPRERTRSEDQGGYSEHFKDK